MVVPLSGPRSGHRLLLTTGLFMLSCSALAQFGAARPPDTYRSAENPLYWKNDPPYPGYWQQDVRYVIRAGLDDGQDLIAASLDLDYFNNSPDTLREAYFHLYQNAFQPGSYLDDLNTNNGVRTRWGPNESRGLGTVIDTMTVQDALSAYSPDTVHDFSVLKVSLRHPLAPGDSLRFHFAFRTWFDSGSQRRRMKVFSVNGNKQYDGVHWYPRICVYDRKAGWHTDQHLGREFYGDFGSYDVSLSLPNQYIVEATGTLQNPGECLPDTLLDRIAIRRFRDKPFNSPAEWAVLPDGSRKRWHYYAENVHDFAWTADPTYRRSVTMLTLADGRQVQCVAMVQ